MIYNIFLKASLREIKYPSIKYVSLEENKSVYSINFFWFGEGDEFLVMFTVDQLHNIKEDYIAYAKALKS